MYKSLDIGDFVFLKKAHPSGTTKWILIKKGFNFKFQSFEHFDLFIELSRDKMNKQIKKVEKKEK